MKSPKRILITGATSGIGEALAKDYAASGVELFLTGRDAVRLARISAMCKQKHAVTEIKSMDVTDAKTIEEWIESIEELDLVIANAGISGGTAEGEDDEQVREIFTTNIAGVLNTVLPAVKKMQEQGAGQIAIMASMAAMRGLPSAPAYSASKACVKAYGQALRGQLHGDGIEVNVICPGYVKTPLTDENDFPMPFLMDTDKASRIIRKGLEKNKAIIAFPKKMHFFLKLCNALPSFITDWFFRKLPKK